MSDVLNKLKELTERIQKILPVLQLDRKKQRLLELEDKMQEPGFWDDQKNAQTISQEHSELSSLVEFWGSIAEEVKSLEELVKNNTDESKGTLDFLSGQVKTLEKAFSENKIKALLSGKYDNHNAIFSIHAGAGGTDAQDWAEMLLRMILRYCEKKNFKTQIISESKGGEAGIKSVTVEVKGAFAYGYLKSEAGVHRLVRLSPFNPAHTRETSFALLELLPLLEENEGVSLDPKDLKIEANTASGHGGQSVNTTYSAIRITHIPTGIKVSIQNERSQHQNKELALKILSAKLKALEEEKLEQEKKELRGEFKSAEWGNQIRSYVLHPYQMVKDHRTNFETSDTEAVLGGELEEFVDAYLEHLNMV